MINPRLVCAALLLVLIGMAFPAHAQPPAAAGGWTYLVDAEHTGTLPEALPLPLILVWRYDTGQGGVSVSTPALDNERVYFVAPKPGPAGGGMLPGAGMPPTMPGPGMPMPTPTVTQPTATPGKSVLYAVSRKTGAWIVPVCVAYESAWALRTWDALLVPRPFSRVVVRYGAPFRVAPEDREAVHLAELEGCLNGLETWAEGVARG